MNAHKYWSSFVTKDYIYYFTETIFCRLSLRMARMEMDCNFKKLG